MRTVNVLLLSGSGEFAGGGEYSLLDLVSALGESRFRPHVVCPGPGTLWERLRVLGIPAEILPFPEWRSARLIAIARALAGLAALVKVRRISLIHMNAIGRVPVYAGLVGRWRRVPVIWHVRVKESEGWKDRLLALLATPNLKDHIFRAAYLLARRDHPSFFEPDEGELHLFHFSAPTLRTPVASGGFDVVEVGFCRGAAAVWGKHLVNEIAYG